MSYLPTHGGLTAAATSDWLRSMGRLFGFGEREPKPAAPPIAVPPGAQCPAGTTQTGTMPDGTLLCSRPAERPPYLLLAAGAAAALYLLRRR